MRLQNMQNIWIKGGGKWWAGNFIAYKGRGMVRIVSGHHGTAYVPREAVKPREKPFHAMERTEQQELSI